MTQKQLRALLEVGGVSQLDLARRLGVSGRYVGLWATGRRRIPQKWVEPIKAALAQRPYIYLSREERLEVAQYLDDLLTRGHRPATPVARLRDKLRASVGYQLTGP